MPTQLIDDESGDLRTGLFYRLHTDCSSTDGFRDLVHPRIHVRDENKYMHGDPLGVESEIVSICKAIPGHVKEMRLTTQVNLELSNSGLHYFDESLTQFITTHSYHVVCFGLAKKLQALSLKGLQIRLANAGNDPETDTPVPAYLIRGNFPPPFKPRIVVPASMNLCPWCRLAPVVCPSCGEEFWRCIHCNRVMFCDRSNPYRGPDDARIVIQQPSLADQVIDVSRWNGDDILGDHAVAITSRMYQRLLELGASTFAVTPLRADVTGVSDATWKLLEDT